MPPVLNTKLDIMLFTGGILVSFPEGIHMSGGNLQDQELQKKIDTFFGYYFDMFREKAMKTKIALATFSLGRPNNFYFAIDRRQMHFIFSSDFAGGIYEVIYMDLREQKGEAFPIQEVATFFRSQKGFSNWQGFSISTDVLGKIDDEIKKEAQGLAQERVQKELNELIKQSQPLFISVEQIGKFLQSAGEDDFTQILLVPLLRHIGFNTAEAKGHRDKSLEFGQDIQRMKLQIPTGHYLYFSAQVKKGNIGSSSAKEKLAENINHILNQTAAQLEWEMPDIENNSVSKPDHVLLIVSGDITESAKQYIFKHDLFKRKRVLLWEKETIIRLCQEKGLPEQVQKIILEYNTKQPEKK